MRRIGRAVILFRVYIRHPGLPRASLANLPVGANLPVQSTCPETHQLAAVEIELVAQPIAELVSLNSVLGIRAGMESLRLTDL